MKAYKISDRIILGLFVTLIFCLFIPQTVFSQTERMGIVQYTPPKGWKKIAKVENGNAGVAFYEDNETTGKFCVITLFGAIESLGNPNKDFESEWNNRAVKGFKAAASPQKLPPESFEGWTVIAGGSKIEYEGRNATIILTMFSGFGKTVSVLAISDDKSYKTQIEAFIESIGIDKTTAPPTSSNGRNIQSNSATGKFGAMTYTSAQSSPEAVIKAFYNDYISSTGKGVDPFGKSSTLKKHLTARLIKEQVTANEASQDADYFLQSQEYHAEWKDKFTVSNSVVKGAGATAIVTFPDDYSRVKVTLRKAAGAWKIDRVENAKL